MLSFTWSFCLVFSCCVGLAGGRIVIEIDSSSLEDGSPTMNRGPRCTDHMKNQDETDIDCGGIKCPKCEDMKSCNKSSDCISCLCTNNTCVPAESCRDKIKNQDETDIDCGGIKCPKCNDTMTCKANCDCISGYCNSNHICTEPCEPVCKNNGTCTSYNNCTCTPDFSGPTCEIQSVGLCFDNETLGSNPIVLISFGHGAAQFSNSSPADFNFSTTYIQQFAPTVEDGHFAIVNSIYNHNNNAWHTNATDHTGDVGGYMLLVNANFKPDQFYNSTVNNLCVGLRYEFSVYLANILVSPSGIQPNVRFEVRSPTTGNQLLAELSSGNVAVHTTLAWKKYGLSFIAPSSTAVLLMISDAPGGVGNDIVLDDIALRVCSNEGNGFCPPH